MEEVLVVERAELEALLDGSVLQTKGLAPVIDFILQHHSFMPREQAEYDATKKQIIPYVILHQAGRYFAMKRLDKQTESRLHHKISLGVGGHINPGEAGAGGQTILEAGLYRELLEEVSIEEIQSLRWVGILNNNDGGVGDYHTGLLCLLEARGDVHVREREKMEGAWMSQAELKEQRASLEDWSAIALEHILTKP